MLGYAAGEYIGHPVTEFHADRPIVDDMLDRLARGETLRNYPARLRCRDGSIRHALISSNARWERGRFAHSRCVVLDVTERRQTDEIRGLLAAVVESTEDAVITKSLEGHILSWNAGARAMLGYAAEEVVGRSVNLIIPDSRREEELEILERVKEAKRVEPFETQRVARDGRIIDVSLTVSPIRDEHGGIIGASSIARDIGQRKALEQSLRDSDRRKDEFLAVLAHELRNPLAPIRSGVAALRLALPDDATLRHVGGIIERQVRLMSRLLDDLLDVSRITHNKLELRMEPLTLQAVIDSALETSRPLVAGAGQTVSVTAPPEPVPIVADPMRHRPGLRQPDQQRVEVLACRRDDPDRRDPARARSGDRGERRRHRHRRRGAADDLRRVLAGVAGADAGPGRRRHRPVAGEGPGRPARRPGLRAQPGPRSGQHVRGPPAAGAGRRRRRAGAGRSGRGARRSAAAW